METGPRGMGPMTGWGRGWCSGGMGWGRGFGGNAGYGRFGMGRGFGGVWAARFPRKWRNSISSRRWKCSRPGWMSCRPGLERKAENDEGGHRSRRKRHI